MPGTTTALRQDAFLAELLAWHAVRTPGKPAVIHPDGDRMESAADRPTRRSATANSPNASPPAPPHWKLMASAAVPVRPCW